MVCAICKTIWRIGKSTGSGVVDNDSTQTRRQSDIVEELIAIRILCHQCSRERLLLFRGVAAAKCNRQIVGRRTVTVIDHFHLHHYACCCKCGLIKYFAIFCCIFKGDLIDLPDPGFNLSSEGSRGKMSLPDCRRIKGAGLCTHLFSSGAFESQSNTGDARLHINRCYHKTCRLRPTGQINHRRGGVEEEQLRQRLICWRPIEGDRCIDTACKQVAL